MSLHQNVIEDQTEKNISILYNIIMIKVEVNYSASVCCWKASGSRRRDQPRLSARLMFLNWETAERSANGLIFCSLSHLHFFLNPGLMQSSPAGLTVQPKWPIPRKQADLTLCLQTCFSIPLIAWLNLSHAWKPQREEPMPGWRFTAQKNTGRVIIYWIYTVMARIKEATAGAMECVKTRCTRC